jgi:hypothetical protein
VEEAYLSDKEFGTNDGPIYFTFDIKVIFCKITKAITIAYCHGYTEVVIVDDRLECLVQKERRPDAQRSTRYHSSKAELLSISQRRCK